MINSQSLFFDKSMRTALITGGGGFLGIEHAYALSKENYNIILTDISKDSLNRAKKNLVKRNPSIKINCCIMDVLNEKNVTSILNKFNKLGIDINILINNAAINPSLDNNSSLKNNDRIENLSISNWERELNVSLTGTLICSKVFGSSMAEKKSGVIINIGSDLSIIAPDQSLYEIRGTKTKLQPVKPISYSVSKHGVIGLTKYLAVYWAEQGIRVNAVSPGGVYNKQNKNFIRKLIKKIPMKRMAYTEDLHEVIRFLCSENNKYMTGQNIIIDGGRTII